ncbi:hypothetical protein SPRG_03655, partial [Saprolegnia parasitica CBS 223.65]
MWLSDVEMSERNREPMSASTDAIWDVALAAGFPILVDVDVSYLEIARCHVTGAVLGQVHGAAIDHEVRQDACPGYVAKVAQAYEAERIPVATTTLGQPARPCSFPRSICPQEQHRILPIHIVF